MDLARARPVGRLRREPLEAAERLDDRVVVRRVPGAHEVLELDDVAGRDLAQPDGSLHEPTDRGVAPREDQDARVRELGHSPALDP